MSTSMSPTRNAAAQADGMPSHSDIASRGAVSNKTLAAGTPT